MKAGMSGPFIQGINPLYTCGLFHCYILDESNSSKKNPQKLTQLSPRSHPRHLVGKRTVQKYGIKDIVG